MSNLLLPADETQRLAALRSYALLDSPPEQGFDRITHLAAQIFQVPIALVSLVDVNRQWFKSCYGLDAKETPRDISFCTHAILGNDVFVIPNAIEDVRFADNPLVTGAPYIRFYAGAPLRTEDGFNIGTLCLIDTNPREFNEQQCALLQDLAALTMSEMQLHQNERGFRSLLANSSDIITVLNADATIAYESPSIERVLGYRPDELVGKSVFDYVHPDDVNLVQAAFSELIKNSELCPVAEFRWKHKDGRWCFLESVANNRLGDESIRGIVASSRDVSQRKEIERQRLQAEGALRDSRLRKIAILETALDCIISFDYRGCVMEWNPAAEATFGYTKQEALGQELADLIIPSQAREAYRAELTKSLGTGPETILGKRQELLAVCKEGQEIWVEMAVNRIPIEGPPVFTAYLRDITGRKRDEQSLMNAMEEAELQRENAQRANLAKSQFLSRMSHELRTPLNAILGFGQLLETSTLSEPDQQSVQQIMKAGSHLLDLIDEVLDISRIESGNLGISLEPVNVHEICADALALVKPLAAQRSISCEMNLHDCETSYIVADNQRIKQALLNLLSNAVKYNCEGGCISLQVSESSSDYLRISVKDSGHGIAPEKMDRLFTPFDRLDAETSGIQGTGIGLAIAHRMVEAMNGTLGVESEVGTGSTFWIEMPQTISPFLDVSPAITYEYSGDVSTQSVVLYIEDNVTNFELMQRIVSHRPNLKLRFAQNGDLGIELARRYRPDLILLDLHLPETSGEEVLQQLRLEPETCNIPVVVISADATSGNREFLMQAGADDYLSKPFDMHDLLYIVDQKITEKQLPL